MVSGWPRGQSWLVDWTLERISSQIRIGQALECAAHACGRVLIPGGIEEMCGRGSRGHRLLRGLSKSS